MHQASLKIMQLEKNQVRCFLPPVTHKSAGILSLNWTAFVLRGVVRRQDKTLKGFQKEQQ